MVQTEYQFVAVNGGHEAWFACRNQEDKPVILSNTISLMILAAVLLAGHNFGYVSMAKAEQQSPRLPMWGAISELRLGVLSHDVRFPNIKKLRYPNPFDNRYESGLNINPEVVFLSPEFLGFLGAPRPHLGFSANIGSDTNSAYTGLGWDTSWHSGIFLEGFLGVAVHDGKLRNGEDSRIEFGSRVLARLGGEFGWRWDGANGVSLIWEHMSNAGILSDKNQGIDSLGIRYSYRFGK